MSQPTFPVMVNRSHLSNAIASLLLTVNEDLRLESARAYAEMLVTLVCDLESVTAGVEHAAEELAMAHLHEDFRKLDKVTADGYRFRAALVVSSFLTRLAHRPLHVDPSYSVTLPPPALDDWPTKPPTPEVTP